MREGKKLMKENLVSIIIPVYNVEDYLKRCVDSIIGQTYKNIEIILIDDGSTDKSGNICDDYLKADKRIKVIHKKNGGLSDARNFGLNISQGDYVCFVDSDDFVSELYVEKLLENSLRTGADVCACNFYYIDEFNKKWIKAEKQEKIYKSDEAIKDIFTVKQNTEVMVWNKIYKKELFDKNDIKFPVGKIHEDNFTTYKIYDKANYVSLINDKLYYYYQRSDSIMGKAFNKKRFDILIALKEIKKYFSKDNRLQKEVQCNELLINISLLNNMIKANYSKKMQLKIKNSIVQEKKSYLKNNLIPFSKKIMIMILSINYNLYSKLLIMLKK